MEKLEEELELERLKEIEELENLEKIKKVREERQNILKEEELLKNRS
jgi:hypothetical protein